MKKSDRELGMDRGITRRDFLNAVSVAELVTDVIRRQHMYPWVESV